MSQASAEAGYVVPTVGPGTFVLGVVIIVGAAIAAYLVWCVAVDWWRAGADARRLRERERVEAGVARSVARAAEDAGRGGR